MAPGSDAPTVVVPAPGVSPSQRSAEEPAQLSAEEPKAATSEEPGGALVRTTAEQPAVSDATFGNEELEPAVDPFVDEYDGTEYNGTEYDPAEAEAEPMDVPGRPSSSRETP